MEAWFRYDEGVLHTTGQSPFYLATNFDRKRGVGDGYHFRLDADFDLLVNSAVLLRKNNLVG